MNKCPLLVSLLVCFPLLVLAGGDGSDGHSHGEETTPLTVINPNTPQRQLDGSVFLPKTSQRFIQVRTQPAKLETLPRSLILNGQVVAGMDASSKVQALQAGRLDIANGSLPAIGDKVEKGQVLATLTLAKDAQEGTNQAAEAADLQEQLKLAELEQQRLQGLGELIPRREVDTAAATVRSLQARLAVFRKGAKGVTETVRSPISGIVTASHAANGQAVQAGDLLLDIIDPSKLQVEAVTYDPALPANIAAANVTIGKQTLALRYQGNSQQLRQQALPLRFSVEGETLAQLAAGSPVQVTVQTRETLQGVAVPAEALARNPSNQTVVWVKTTPEQYAPRVVQYQPLDGERVMITAGLPDGERVVVQATNLINQIR
ncbi:HlyD family efflux transporter periplasmic adaptor subunit [Thiothrix unzii]|jgi:multidrug efflux pump subunit AcrA (membrane-fusion protein)|uniref:efflux RND transporter periplasmic adaptor subunit n=1 Tax=Thiothrix unzii TaxID=111769 RepID=UPI002A3679D3|nr:HlyD family efflux transporter periplasmic adaptor subunit [Thiothrix unzii]MDX9987416.1 efflux RND transporter periplasmic adaptor subunit [Thiothrix unzii]